MQKLNHNSRLVLLATSGIALAISAPATAQDSAKVEIRAGAVASTNPFLQVADDGEELAFSIEVLPQIQWEDERGVVKLSGSIRYEEWLDSSISDISGNVSIGAERRVSETLDMFGSLTYLTRERAAPDLLSGSAAADELADLGVVEIPLDPTLNDRSERRQSAFGTFGIAKRVSQTQSLTAQISNSMDWLDGLGVDYRTTTLQLGYNQQLNPRLAIFLAFSGRRSDYLDQAEGDGIFGDASAGLNLQLSRTGSLRVSAGVGAISVENALGNKDDKTLLIGQVQFCEELAKGKFCLSGSRQSRPTGLAGASTVTSFGLAWGTDVGRDGRFSLNLTYSDTEAELAGFDLVSLSETKYATASANLSLPITDKLGFFISPGATKLFDDPLGRDENYQVRLGISYMFGR